MTSPRRKAASASACLLALFPFFAPLPAAELVPLNEFASASDYSQNFVVSAGFSGLSIAHSSADDGGIGRGGFVTLPFDLGATSNLIYNGAGPSTFGDATLTVDNFAGSSIGFVIRGNASRSDSIRVLLSDRARVRIYTGADPSAAGTSGTVVYDVTGSEAPPEWNHLRLHVRNGGDGGDQVELHLQIYDSQARFDETTLAAEHTLLLSAENSAPYLAPGEIGLNLYGRGNRIDNFAVYEYGTAPARLPHPDLFDFSPLADAQYHAAEEGFRFRATAPSGIDPNDIYMTLNGVDVSSELEISGEPEDLSIRLLGLETETDYVAKIEVVANSGEITTREIAFRTTPPRVPVPLIELVDFATEADLTEKFATTAGPVTYMEEWDGGIGRGGFLRGTQTSNNIYDTDGSAETETFQDFSMTLDHRHSGTVTFLIRANRELDDSIRVSVSERNRMRVWTGSSIATDEAGPQVFDETIASTVSNGGWAHYRLDVRNIGEAGDRQIEIRLRAFQSQTELIAPGFDLTFTLEPWDSAPYLEAGEVGFRTGGGVTNVDNFGIYEYGTAPLRRLHPRIDRIAPAPGAMEIPENSALSFQVTGIEPAPPSGVAVSVNGEDVSADLAFVEADSRLLVTYPFLNPGDEVHIEATVEGATTSRFFDYPPLPTPFSGRLRTLYDSGGFQNDTAYPAGDLLVVQHGGGEWIGNATAPGRIVEVAEPFGKVLRTSSRYWLRFPEARSGIVTLDLDLRVSSTAARTLDLGFMPSTTSSTQWAFLGWGTVAGQFTYYDGSAWIPLMDSGTEWRNYRVVNYLTGPYANTYDLFVDGVAVGEKLPFRHGFNPETHSFGTIRFNISGADYVEIDNVLIEMQPLSGIGELPYAQIGEIVRDAAGASISFDTYLGYDYVIEYRDALGGAGGWTELTTISGTGWEVTVDDPGASGDRRFYRVTTRSQ